MEENFSQFEQTKFSPNRGQNEPLKNLPNATLSMVLGIIGVVTVLVMPIISGVLSIVAIVLGNKAVRTFYRSPQRFREGDRGQASAGKILGIIGLCLTAVYVMFIIILFFFFGLAFTILGGVVDAIQ